MRISVCSSYLCSSYLRHRRHPKLPTGPVRQAAEGSGLKGKRLAEVALLSNPRSTGNRSLLPKVRSFCARHPEIFHYEVEEVEQIGEALRTIARVKQIGRAHV